MRNPELATLRLKRARVHQALARLEPAVADYEAKLAELEAAIQVIAPELQLHPRRYKPSPVFTRGELPRLALTVLREADGAIPTRLIAARALALKGIPFPDPHILSVTRRRLQQMFVKWSRKGMLVTYGEGNERRRRLAQT